MILLNHSNFIVKKGGYQLVSLSSNRQNCRNFRHARNESSPKNAHFHRGCGGGLKFFQTPSFSVTYIYILYIYIFYYYFWMYIWQSDFLWMSRDLWHAPKGSRAFSSLPWKYESNPRQWKVEILELTTI